MCTTFSPVKPEIDEMLTMAPRSTFRVSGVAYASLFLALDEASYITGTELIDGGYLSM